MTSKVYRHKVTGIETTLDEKFVKVFGDVFEPVTKTTARKSTKKTEESDSSKNDSSKEGTE